MTQKLLPEIIKDEPQMPLHILPVHEGKQQERDNGGASRPQHYDHQGTDHIAHLEVLDEVSLRRIEGYPKVTCQPKQSCPRINPLSGHNQHGANKLSNRHQVDAHSSRNPPASTVNVQNALLQSPVLADVHGIRQKAGHDQHPGQS